MYASLLFWLTLALPGYVVVRHLSKDDLDSGLLGTIGLSYLAVFGLLSPVSILCYLLRAPLWCFSAACVVAVVAGAIEVTRRGWWREIGKLFVGGLSVGLLIVAADMVMGARVGARLGGDAVLHLTRIRFLLDHGFSNQDPFIAGAYFFPTYHTNLLHALYAACSQLSGTHHMSVWFASLAWGKLLIAAGAYYMSWCVFGRRWVALVAAVFVVGYQGPVNFLVYPNKLAPLWIGALMIGFAVQACTSPCSWRSPLKLCVGSLVLGQIHSLYGAFAGIVLGPILICIGLVRIFRRQPDRWRVAACTVALTAALPFLLVSKFTVSSPSRSSSITKAPTKEGAVGAVADKGWVTMGPRSGWGTIRGWRPICLAVGVICALAGSRRKQAAMLLAVAGTAALIFYIPPLCTAALGVLGEKWILGRMGFVLLLGFVGLVPASVAFLVEPKTRFWFVRSILSVLVLLFGIAFATPKEPFAWRGYLSQANADQENRQGYLNVTRSIVDFFEDNIPRGVTVLADDWPGMVLTMVHDCHIVASRGGNKGVPDIVERRKDLKTMLAANTPWPRRRALLRKYDIEYFLAAGPGAKWIRGHVKKYPTDRIVPLYVLDTDR